MTRARLSDAGSLDLPQSLREAVGLVPGGEVEITTSAGRLIVAPVPATDVEGVGERKLTMAEFLAMRVAYDGPPITDATMRDGIDAEARRMWAEFERQNDAPVDD